MRRTILILASMAVVLVLASSAAFALLSTGGGGPIQRVAIARENAGTPNTVRNTEFLDVPGAELQVSVPPGAQSRLVMARFSAESVCSGGTGPQACYLRIVARKTPTGPIIAELQPSGGTIFDSTNAGSETLSSWESHSMDKSLRFAEGDYTVSVQQRVTDSHVRFALNNWSFTVEQSQ
jgi:hypothetical protein